MVFSFYPGFSPEEASLTMAGIWWLLWSLQSSTRPKKAQLVYSNAESRDKQSSETTQKGAAVPMYVSVIYKLYIYIQWHINDLYQFYISMTYQWFMMIYGPFSVYRQRKNTLPMFDADYSLCVWKKKIPENTGTRKHTPCKHLLQALLQEHSRSECPRSFEHLQTCCSMVI
jgi:hypothetical protein